MGLNCLDLRGLGLMRSEELESGFKVFDALLLQMHQLEKLFLLTASVVQLLPQGCRRL